MEILREEIRRSITTEEMEQFAAETARSIVIRHTVCGNSNDRRRDTTPEEASIIQRIIYSALLSIRCGYDISATANAAELIGIQFLPGADAEGEEPHTNAYDTIYLPIKKWARLQQQKISV